jgi:hypothetical protein
LWAEEQQLARFKVEKEKKDREKMEKEKKDKEKEKKIADKKKLDVENVKKEDKEKERRQKAIADFERKTERQRRHEEEINKIEVHEHLEGDFYHQGMWYMVITLIFSMNRHESTQIDVNRHTINWFYVLLQK